jgi:hypothetical protein
MRDMANKITDEQKQSFATLRIIKEQYEQEAEAALTNIRNRFYEETGVNIASISVAMNSIFIESEAKPVDLTITVKFDTSL